jgi:hypothetical protein
VARAIAEGIGPGATAMPTSEALPSVIAAADLIVAGAPVNAFGLPTEQVRQTIANQPATPPPDLSHESLRSWLDHLSIGSAMFAAFETRLRWSPGSATSGIQRRLKAGGYREIAAPAKFVVTGGHGPLRDGEVERARAWGADLWAATRGDSHRS